MANEKHIHGSSLGLFDPKDDYAIRAFSDPYRGRHCKLSKNSVPQGSRENQVKNRKEARILIRILK